jgi:hypothetical protein
VVDIDHEYVPEGVRGCVGPLVVLVFDFVCVCDALQVDVFGVGVKMVSVRLNVGVRAAVSDADCTAEGLPCDTLGVRETEGLKVNELRDRDGLGAVRECVEVKVSFWIVAVALLL